MATMNLRFAFEKETKGAVRFQEVGEDGKPAFAPSIGTLYIRCRSFRYSDHSGATSSLLHWTQVIPNLERRLDSIVVMVISLIPLRCNAKW